MSSCSAPAPNVVPFALTVLSSRPGDDVNGEDARDRILHSLRVPIRPDLFCAVPKSHPVPDFLVGPSWKFKGTLDRNRDKPSGFKEKAARDAIQRDGYYYFFVRSREM